MSDVEQRARAMGWLPEGEFKGDPDKWRPAEEFLERGETILPILQERLGKMEKDLEAKTAKLERVTNNLTKFADHHKTTYKRAYENAKRDIERRLKQAREEGDFEAYDQAMQDMAENEEKNVALEGQPGEPVPEFFDFKKANPWYGQDLAMTVFVDHVAPSIAQTVSSDVEFFAKLEQAARQEFPHKFSGQAAATAVEGSTSIPTEQSKGKKGWRDLPAEAKQAYMDNFAAIDGFKKEDYAKDYWAQEGV